MYFRKEEDVHHNFTHVERNLLRPEPTQSWITTYPTLHHIRSVFSHFNDEAYNIALTFGIELIAEVIHGNERSCLSGTITAK